MRLHILYQDADLIVVDKPIGVPTHAPDPADPYPADALRAVQAQTGLTYLGMHQRLDADTSGVLLFSARPEANRSLAAAFEGRRVRKVYLALVWGAPPRAEGVIDAAIARDRDGRYRITAASDPHKMTAVTRYRVLGALGNGTASSLSGTEPPGRKGDGVQSKDATFAPRSGTGAVRRPPSGAVGFSAQRTQPAKASLPEPAPGVFAQREITLLEIVPETGRPHQIRVHLAHIGCPVVGDPLYLSGTQSVGPADRFPRLCLHAWQLTLPHPTTGEIVTFTAPPPVIFQLISDAAVGITPDENIAEHPERRAAARSPRVRSGLRVTSHPLIDRYSLSSSASDPAQEAFVFESEALREIFRLTAQPSPHVRSLAARDPAGLRALLRLAAARRAPLAADPATTIYRLVNAAADGLPGLTVDRYGDALAVSLYDDDDRLPPAPILPALTEALVEVMGPRAIYVKYRPQQASRIAEADRPLLAPPQPVYGPDLGEFVAHEDGRAYLIRPGEGLSVGLFPDMREGRGRVAAWAAGRTVLNTFAYTCGFGVAALAGGAARVLNLDLSKAALAWGQENYRANGFAPDPHDFVYGDVFDWLARLAKRGERFDLVILDPPGFSRTKGGRFAAAQDYAALAELAGRVLAPGGRLLACCNVAELPWRSFRARVLAGVAAAGRDATVLGVYHEPALDFPTLPGQEPYLKMVWVQ